MIKIFLKHFQRHWRVNALLFLGFVLCAGVLASLPQLAIAISGNSLSQFIEDTSVPNRNLLVIGSTVTDTIPPEIALGLGELLQEIITVRETKYPAQSVIFHPDGTAEDLSPVTINIDLWSFDLPEKRFYLIGGRLPGNSVTVSNLDNLNIPVFEAAIGEKAADSSNLVIGDYLAASNHQFLVKIVGILAPIDPKSEVWWGDTQITPFNMWRRVYQSPDIDEMNISLILHPEPMASRLSRAVEWRVILDHRKITTENIDSVKTEIQELQGRLKGLNLTLQTGLLVQLEKFQEKMTEANTTLFLLSVQSFIAVIYMLNLLGNFVLERSRLEMSTLASRGFTRLELTVLLAGSSGVLAITAWPVAISMVNLIFKLGTLTLDTPFPTNVPDLSWWFALGGIIFGWVLYLVNTYRSTRREALLWHEEGGILDYQFKRTTYVWDIMLLVFGVLVYWQFSQGGSLSKITNTISQTLPIGSSDPVLLLGPTLLILAAGLVLLRFFPFIFRFFAWILRHIRGLLLPLGLTRMARLPTDSTRAILLISMTAGLTFFATVFNHSLNTWYEIMAPYTVGADFRIVTLSDEPIPTENIQELPGVTAVTRVYRGDFSYQFDEFQEFKIDLLAVDPETFSQVVSYPNGVSPFTMEEVMKVLEPDSPDTLPLVISDHPINRHLGLHEKLVYEFGSEEIPFDVSGIIVEFPLLNPPFAVTNLDYLEQATNLDSPSVINRGGWEQWIKIIPGQHDKVREGILKVEDEFSKDESIIKGDSKTLLESFRSNLVSLEATTAFQLNALILIPLSVLGFLLIQIFTAWKRRPELIILQKLGFSSVHFGQWAVLEWSIVIIFGLGIGIGIGYGLAALMEPFHTSLLNATIGATIDSPLVVPWDAIGLRFLILYLLYGITIYLSIVFSQRLKR